MQPERSLQGLDHIGAVTAATQYVTIPPNFRISMLGVPGRETDGQKTIVCLKRSGRERSALKWHRRLAHDDRQRPVRTVAFRPDRDSQPLTPHTLRPPVHIGKHTSELQ